MKDATLCCCRDGFKESVLLVNVEEEEDDDERWFVEEGGCESGRSERKIRKTLKH